MSRHGDDESRKQQIRAAAVQCFVRRGFSATRLLDIAQQAGMSKGGVYFYYHTKERLFADVLDAQLAQTEARWAFSPVSDEPATPALTRLVELHLQGIEDDPNDTRLGHLLVAMSPQSPAYREKLGVGHSLIKRLYASVIHRGIREGVFKGGDPDQLADLVLALVQGLAVQTAADAEGKLPMRPTVAAQFVLRMLSPTSPVLRAAGKDDAPTRPTLQS